MRDPPILCLPPAPSFVAPRVLPSMLMRIVRWLASLLKRAQNRCEWRLGKTEQLETENERTIEQKDFSERPTVWLPTCHSRVEWDVELCDECCI